MIFVGGAGNFYEFERGVGEIGTWYARTSGDADVLGRRAGEHTQLLKRSLDGCRNLRCLFLVSLRGSIEHDKESKEQSDEVGVGNEPALMVGVSLMSAAAGSRAGRRFLLRLLLVLLQVAQQHSLKHARIHAFKDGDHTFQLHFAQHLFFAKLDLQLSGPGKKKNVGSSRRRKWLRRMQPRCLCRPQ